MTKFKYILKDSLNTYISIHNTEEEIYKKLNELSKKFKDTFSTFGGGFNDSPIFEDNAVFRIPLEMQKYYNNNKFITFYFFKFDIDNNKIVELYK